MFGSEGVTALGDESLAGAAWEILYNAVNKTIARVQARQGPGCWVDGRAGGQQACARDGTQAGGALRAARRAGLPAGCWRAALLRLLPAHPPTHPPIQPPPHLLQDAREDLAAGEAAVNGLQAQVDALMAAGELAGEPAQQLDEALAALEVRCSLLAVDALLLCC